MAGISGYGWKSSKVSAWKQFEAWRAARKAATESLIANNENFHALFSQAHSNKIQGTAKLAMEAAANRVNLAAKAKLNEAVKQIDAFAASTSVDKKI